MEQVGYETYTKLLEENIRELKGEEIEKEEKKEDILFNIKDFNKITKRLYETHYFAPDKVMLPHFDEDAINTFVETSDNSHIMSRKENLLIKYDAGNEDFWKKYL